MASRTILPRSARIDLTIEIEDRHLRREYRATIAHRQDIDTVYAEGRGIGRVRMHHGGHVRPRLHDLQMQETLVDGLDATLESVPLKLESNDVVHICIDQRTATGMEVTEDEH